MNVRRPTRWVPPSQRPPKTPPEKGPETTLKLAKELTRKSPPNTDGFRPTALGFSFDFLGGDQDWVRCKAETGDGQAVAVVVPLGHLRGLIAELHQSIDAYLAEKAAAEAGEGKGVGP